MIKDIGIDIVFLPRFVEKVKDGKFIEKILGPQEQSYFYSITHEARKIEYLACRFSVKEAVFKAIGKQYKPLTYQSIEVLFDENGKPIIHTHFPFEGELLVSISHDESYAITQVVFQSQDIIK